MRKTGEMPLSICIMLLRAALRAAETETRGARAGEHRRVPRRRKMRLKTLTLTCLLCAGFLGAAAPRAETSEAEAKAAIKASGVKGGLLVHLGCGDGKLTAALRQGESWLVHGLDRDAANVEKARAQIRKLGVYGKVSVDQLRGNALPYADTTGRCPWIS
ncbi:MAG: class I SAM-dependent methyltransferase [Planctomycetota bacterium]|jgi:2-polyprenyl-3-methyl-5-hydroxy-6-metoxy-1,4-benzoquinol methylase